MSARQQTPVVLAAPCGITVHDDGLPWHSDADIYIDGAEAAVAPQHKLRQ